MAKVKYYAKENSTIGTHSFYAVPIPNGTLTFDELLDEAMDGKSVEPSRGGHHRGWRQSRWQPGRRYDWRGAGGIKTTDFTDLTDLRSDRPRRPAALHFYHNIQKS